MKAKLAERKSFDAFRFTICTLLWGLQPSPLVAAVGNRLISTMKNKNYLLPFLLFFTIAASAQMSSPENLVYKKDIIKINVLALPLKNISVQYERILSRKISAALGIRSMPQTSLPFKNILINEVGNNDPDTKDVINNSRISNLAITPELRFYLGKGYGRGFYIAPYYRYVRFSTNSITINYSEPNGPKQSLSLSGDMSANTGGVMFGAQWLLGKHVTLDWWILGAQYGTGTGNFNGLSSKSFTPGEQADIKQTLDDVDIPLVTKTVSVSANNVHVNVGGPFGGLRSGLLIGIRF